MSPRRIGDYALSRRCAFQQFAAEFLSATRQACLHQWQTARICQNLAERTSNLDLQSVYCSLAENAEKKAERYLGRLKRLDVRLPKRRETTCQRMARWLLVRVGPRLALWWTERVQRNDHQRLSDLSHLLHRFAPSRLDKEYHERDKTNQL